MSEERNCPHWHEDNVGRGLTEICRLTGRETTCCADEKECACDKTRREADDVV